MHFIDGTFKIHFNNAMTHQVLSFDPQNSQDYSDATLSHDNSDDMTSQVQQYLPIKVAIWYLLLSHITYDEQRFPCDFCGE